MASKFELDLRRFSERIKTDHAKAVGKIGLDLATRIIQRTPVDTGLARGGWSSTIGQPSTEERERLDPTGQQAISEATNVFSRPPPFPVLYISNNVRYISLLNSGSSMQAPNGMVALSIAEIEAFYR